MNKLNSVAMCRINKLNSVQPPNVLKALGVMLVGVVLIIFCRALLEGWGTPVCCVRCTRCRTEQRYAIR